MEKKIHIIIETYDNQSFIYSIINKDTLLGYYEDIPNEDVFEERLKEFVSWTMLELETKLKKDMFISFTNGTIINIKEIKKAYWLPIKVEE
jgi:hypothetical protein